MKEHLAQELIHRYLDGELEDDQVAGFEAHLEDCPLCRRRMEGLQRTIFLIEHLERLCPPPGFTAQVMVALRLRRRALPRWQRVVAKGFAPVTGLLGLLLLIMSRGQTGAMMEALASSSVSLDALTAWLSGLITEPLTVIAELSASGLDLILSLSYGLDSLLLMAICLLSIAHLGFLAQLLSVEQQEVSVPRNFGS